MLQESYTKKIFRAECNPQWLKREINQAWEKRAEITPSAEGAPKPQVFEILKLLPRSNCRDCGEPTCMVFAARAAEGIRGVADCPPLKAEARQRLEGYLGRFNFDAFQKADYA